MIQITNSGTDFSKGNVTTVIIKQALPLIVAQIAALLYNIVDRIYIGHIPGIGADALTGVGITFPIVSLISAFTQLFGMGGCPLFSMARGAGDNKKASNILCNSFFLLTISSIVLTIVGYVTLRPVLYLFGASNVTYEYARNYMHIYLAGTILLMIGTGLNNYISSQGFPVIAMITTICGAVINAILDPIFIFAMNLGIRGAAIATLISQAVSFIWVIRFLRSKKAIIKLNCDIKNFNLSTCLSIMKIGLTNFVMESMNSAVQIVSNHILVTYGDIYVGIMTVINSVRQIMGVAVNGITSGAQPVLSFNYGAGLNKRVKSAIKSTSLIASAYTALAWLAVFIFPQFFIGIFTDDVAMLSTGVKYLHIYFMAYIFMSFQFSGQSTFLALGMSKPAIFFSLLRKAIIVIPLTILLPYLLKDSVSGVFWAEPISNIIGGSASFLTMYFTVYRKLDKKPSNRIKINA